MGLDLMMNCLFFLYENCTPAPQFLTRQNKDEFRMIPKLHVNRMQLAALLLNCVFWRGGLRFFRWSFGSS